LLHDPLIKRFREHRAWKKKVKKAKAKKENEQVNSLIENKPSYSLNHLVKERYPTFIDAVRDLDDALSMIFLFANMPSTKKNPSMEDRKMSKINTRISTLYFKNPCITKSFY